MLGSPWGGRSMRWGSGVALGLLWFGGLMRWDSRVIPGVGAGGGMPFAKRCWAGIGPAIGFKSGPIGGHGRFPHHDGLAVKYKLLGIVWSGIFGSHTTSLCT